MATAAAGNREIIRFEPGKAETVVLKYAQGKEIDGKYGAQFMYTTMDGRIFFLDPDVGRALEDLRLRENEAVAILKTKRARGGFDWDVERVRRPQLVEETAPPPPAPPMTAAAAPAPEPAPGVNTETARMMSCFKSAIDAVSEAQTYANRKSLGITFTSENITSAALSCYINKCREGRG